MSSFMSELRVIPLPDGKNWKLTRPFSYHVGSQHSKTIIKVPAGFVTDFASIPTFIIAVLGLIGIYIGNHWGINQLFLLGIVSVLCASVMPRWGKYGKAAVIHDYLYHIKMFNRRMSDGIFLEAMKVLGVVYVERYAMYYAVRWLAFLSWKYHK